MNIGVAGKVTVSVGDMQRKANDMIKSSNPGAVGWKALGRRIIPALAVAIACSLVLAPAARGDDYGFIEGSYYAKAHEPTTNSLSIGLIPPSQIRNAVLAAPDVYQAGAHPDASTGFRIVPGPDGTIPMVSKDIMVDAPPGFIGSATAVPECPVSVFMRGRFGECENLSQVGITAAQIRDTTGVIQSLTPVFKLPPPPGAPARFGYKTTGGQSVFLVPRLRSEGDYGLRIQALNLPTNFGLMESATTLWGVPYDPIHDVHRVQGPGSQSLGGTIPDHVEKRAFLTNPTYCDSGPLERTIHARTWLDPDEWFRESVSGAQAPDGCDRLEFGTRGAPVSLTAQPTTQTADSPTGLEVNLSLPFNHNPDGLARPTLRDTTVELPEGLALNPSAADGLRSCSEAEVGLDSLDPPACPEASKVASIEVDTPLLSDNLHGSMFLAEQDRNPLNATMAIYLYVQGSGVQVKLPGRVNRDPESGKVTSTFRDNPQLPFTDMTIRFKSGPRAPLVTPRTCEEHETESTLTPWSHPHTGPPVESPDSFPVDSGPNGTDCVSSPAERDFDPELRAGTTNPGAGESSPFVARFTRGDGEQEFDSIELQTPEGLSANLSGIPYCAESGIARAINRDDGGDGALEESDPSCPEASKVGRTVIGAGSGPSPYYVEGEVYLAGPYEGAPLSLAFIVPAVAGPFDLGVQVVRTAVHVDDRTAQITAVSDEIPKILDGVPLRIRDIRVLMDRENFTVNPTSCRGMEVQGAIAGTHGTRAERSSPFRVADCAALDFEPRFGMQILNPGRRSTVRSFNPAMRFTVAPRQGDANLGPTQVVLPSSVILDQSNIRTVCTRPQFAERNCPDASIYGFARAWSPLLDEPLQGPVYLGSSPNPLPDIIADLKGQVDVVLQGQIDSVRAARRGRDEFRGARMRNSFDVVPDVPVTRFSLTMLGGANRGVLVNSRDLCTSRERGVALFNAQNEKRSVQRPAVRTAFRGCRRVRRLEVRRTLRQRAMIRKAVRSGSLSPAQARRQIRA